jgi:hypothetical protein
MQRASKKPVWLAAGRDAIVSSMGGRRQFQRRASGPPPAVLGLLIVEVVAAVVLLAIGVGWKQILVSAGPLVALTLALLNPTVQEFGRARPKVRVSAAEAGDGVSVAAAALRPWPIDVERIVANELADARQSVELADKGIGAFDGLLGFSDPFTIRRPTAEDFEKAKADFAETVEQYEAELRDWLASYQDAARRRADTFSVTLRLDNVFSGAHARGVTVHVALAGTVERVFELPEIDVPPTQPRYVRPRPRRVDAGWFRPVRALAPPIEALYRRRQVSLPPDPWKTVDSSRGIEVEAGDVQAGRVITLGTRLLFRVDGPGRHDLNWTVFSESLPHPKTGTIVLDLPKDPERPAFGRVEGILRFPDVPIVDPEVDQDDGDGDDLPEPRIARRDVRDVDPPLVPPATEDNPEDGNGVPDLLKLMREAGQHTDWRRLGLDPADDGPERYEVRRAEPADDGGPAAS